MAETRARDLAKSLGQAVKTDNIASDGSLAIIGVTAYDSAGLLPVSYDSNNAGSLGFAKDSDRLYVHTGQGWFNIAIVNTTPIFDGSGNTIVPNASYDLASDATAYKNGTATVVTIQARDSEGFPIAYAATGNTAFNNIAHVEKDSAAGFIFTIEPKSEDSVGEPTPAAGTLTFTATDGINIATAASTFNLVFDTRVASSESTVLLMRGVGDSTTKNASFDDVSDTNNTITVSGTPYQGTFSPYNSGGYSLWFGTTSKSLVIPDGDWKTLGSTFTIEFWMYPTTIGSSYGRMIFGDTDTGGGNANYQIFGRYQDDGTVTVGGRIDGTNYISSGSEIISTSSSVPLNEWTHIAVTRSSGNWDIYVDGRKDATQVTNRTGTLNNSSQPFNIGHSGYSTDSTYNYNGYIYDFRVVKGTAVYTGDFTPPSEPLTTTGGTYPSSTNIATIGSGHTKLLIGSLPYTSTDKTRDHNISVQASGSGLITTVMTRPFTPFRHKIYDASLYGGSVFMNGTDYLTTSGTANTNTGAGQAWTVEYWVYPQQFDGSGNVMFDFRANGSGNGITAEFTSAGNIYMNSGGTGYISNQDYDIVPRNWYHMAFVHTGSVLKFYLNGIEKYSNTHSSLANDNTSGVFGIGYKTNGTKNFKGYISDFRFVVGKAVYTGAFSPPTGPLTKTGGTYPNNTNRTDPTASETKYLANFTNGDIIDLSGTSNFGFSAASNAQSDTGNQKYSVPSVLFDGSDDVINVEAFGRPFWFPKDFTIECWAYVVSGNFNYQNSRYRTFFYVGISSQFQFAIDASGNPLLWDNGNAIVTSSTALTGNSWQHIAVSRSGDQVVLFLDGVEKARSTHTDEMGGYDNLSRIGAYSGSQGSLNGAISDLRITKGVSRYPFLPLKETLTATTTFQGTAVGNSGSDTKLIAFSTATLTADASGQSNALTISGVTASTFGPDSTMKSALFDGSNDTATVTDNDFGLGNNFTLEAWIYPTAAGGDAVGDIIFMTRNGSNNGAWLSIDSSRHLNAKIIYTGSWTFEVEGTYALELYRWHHVAMVRNSGTIYVFLNGCKYSNGSNNSDITSYTQLDIGHQNNGRHFTGYMSNVRVINGTAIYDTDFTPPSLALKG